MRSEGASPAQSGKRWKWPRETGVIAAFGLTLALFTLFAPRFATADNLLNVTRQYAEVALVSVGMTFVILTGGIDLSVGSVAGLTGVAAGLLAARGGVATGACAAIAAGLGLSIGLLNGVLVGRFRLSPVVVTLATWAGCRSVAYILTNGDSISDLPDSMIALTDIWLFGILPSTALLAVCVVAIASVTLRRTVIGRSLVAQGQNRRAALFSGIRVGWLGGGVYALTGLLAGCAGLFITSRAATADPNAGIGMEFEAITAVVLGGTRITGGYASIAGTTLGVATIGMLQNGFNLMGLDSTWQTLATGLLLLGAVIVDSRVNRA